MKKNCRFAGLTGLLAILLLSCRNVPAEDPAVIKTREIISGMKAVFAVPPEHIPSTKIVDGPITGNGDIGLTVSGPPAGQRYWISKNDFWKSGPEFQQAGPSLIGGLDVRIDGLERSSYAIEQTLYEPVIASRFSNGRTTVSMEARVMAGDHVIVLELKTDKEPVSVDLRLWAKDGYGSETAEGKDGDLVWVSRKFKTDDLLFPTEATVAMRCLESGGNPLTLRPGRPATIIAVVMTNHDSERFQAETLELASRLNRAELRRLRSEHDAWWRSFWAQSYVSIEDKVLEKYYYASQYILACCSRNVNFPPGLYGNWITKDRTSWSGDYHLDYNFQAPYWAAFSSNHVKLADPYDTPLLEQLPVFIRDARTFLQKKGAYASVMIGPKALTLRHKDKPGLILQYKGQLDGDPFDDIAGQPMFCGMKSNSVFAAMNMILRYFYTYDQDYVRKVYPYLIAVADFWEDTLTLENGRYVIRDDSVFEVGPWNGKNWRAGYGDINPITSLGFLRVFFGALIEMSADIRADAGRRDKWKDILARLSDFPVRLENGRTRFRACGGGNGLGANKIGVDWVMLHGLVFPAPNIGLSSPPEEIAMVKNDLVEIENKSWLDHGNAFQTVLIGAARVGMDPDALMAMARQKIAQSAYPNLWLFAEGGGLETCSGIPGMINEMMLQSHGGVIRVFPVFPPSQKASFYRLRTFGAFLASSSVDRGKIRFLLLESEKGRDCTVQNPWPGKNVSLFRDGQSAEILQGDRLSFATRSGEAITLVPEGDPNVKRPDFLTDKRL